MASDTIVRRETLRISRIIMSQIVFLEKRLKYCRLLQIAFKRFHYLM